MVGISPSFVCRGQYWLIYLTVLSVMGNIDWYINRFFLPCTIMFGLSSGFCLSWTVMVGLSPSGQNLLVYLHFLYVMDNSGWYIALICLSRTIMVGISPCLFCHEQK